MPRRMIAAIAAASFVLQPAAALAYRLVDDGDVRRFEVEEGASLVIETKSGRIRVESGETNGIVVRIETVVRAPSKSEARKILARIAFDIESSPRRVSLGADLPRLRSTGLFAGALGDRTSVAVNYLVVVPRRTDLDLVSRNGDIDVRDVEGAFFIETGNGDVAARGLAGEGTLKTVNGRVDCRLDRLERGGNLTIRSGNGPVVLLIPRKTGARLEAGARNGRVRVGFALEDAKRAGRHRVSGVIGDGDGRIAIRTTNGNIDIDNR
ncbi:MAG: DUF4097 family beta strand repeat protein [Candidatus Krumholzibacteriota bacterium]|nr:DUF4097 family beta strand repeat protein [Candidatus Krumholzibacteriota bacterium]